MKSTVEPANTQRPSTRYKSAAPLNLKLPSLNIWDKSNSKLFMFCLLAGLQGSDSAAPDIVVHEPFHAGSRRVVFMGARESRFSLRREILTRLSSRRFVKTNLFIRTGLVVLDTPTVT